MGDLQTLGASGLQSPKLVLGGNVFDWTAKADVGTTILDRFFEGGGTMIDTADVYSAWVPGHAGGESESYIGNWLEKRGRRDDVLIATKVGMLPGEGGKGLEPERIAKAVDASLQRLKTDYIDLYYAHRDDSDIPLKETLQAFSELVDAGKVKALGASNYSAPRLAEALEISAMNSWTGYTVLQPELNLMKRESFAGELQALCIANNIGVLPYFALASGFLTGKYRSSDDFDKSPRGGRMASYMTPRGDAVLSAMDSIAAETGASMAQIALAWCAAQPGVTAPIASATRLDQLDDLMGALRLTLSPEHLAALDQASQVPTE